MATRSHFPYHLPFLAFALAMLGVLTILAPAPAHAQTFTVIHNFLGFPDGYQPATGLSMDRAGNLYGTAPYGGDASCSGEGRRLPGGGGTPPGCGVVFRMKKAGSGWVESPIYIFPGAQQDYLPEYVEYVVVGPNGTLYGTTDLGGNDESGKVFNVGPAPTPPNNVLAPWIYTSVYVFPGNGDNGSNPTHAGRFVFDASGNFYGTTGYGGVPNDGVVYEVSPSGHSWTQSVLYSFNGGSDGRAPVNVVFDDAGNLYGATAYGGNNDCDFSYGCGTIFELTPSQSGWTKTILHVFQQGVDGGWPGAIIRDAAGNLYGMAEDYGPSNGGTVWELSPSNGGWTFTVLYAFPTEIVDDFGPYAPTLDSAGNLYGITSWGGANNSGQVFKLTPGGSGWTFTDLHDFDSEGDYGQGAPVLDSSGNIYGMTEYGGPEDGGTVWEITP